LNVPKLIWDVVDVIHVLYFKSTPGPISKEIGQTQNPLCLFHRPIFRATFAFNRRRRRADRLRQQLTVQARRLANWQDRSW
jgi:hypothetical protein